MLDKGRITILVVDDLEDWRLTLRGILVDEGYSVKLAASKGEALEILSGAEIPLAILDMRLDESDEGNQDGLVLAKTIKREHAGTQVILLTGYGTPDVVSKAMSPGPEGQALIVDYLEKTETDKLLGVIEQTLVAMQ